MSFLNEFKKFAMRGNVIDLAVAVVIGGAFSKIVSSLVDGIIMPLIGLFLGGINIANKALVIGQATVKWGMFLQTVIDFTIIAFCIFVTVKIINVLHISSLSTVTSHTKEEALLTEIRDLLKKNSNQ